MTRSFAVICWAVLSTSCNVATVEQQPSPTPKNQCQSDADCHGVGSCRGGICAAAKGSFDTILLEVNSAADSSALAGAQLFKRVDGLLAQSGPLDLTLDPLAHVSGGVATSATGCTPTFLSNGMAYLTASNHTIPALITAVPTASTLGVFASPISVASTIVPPDLTTYTFQLNAAPGEYDVYIQPNPPPEPGCPVPPQLIRGYKFSGSVSLKIELPQPQVFELHVPWPAGDGALDEWSADMLDSASGYAISNRVTLTPNAKKTDYVADLAYSPVVTSGTPADPLVRISPPVVDGQPKVTAPIVLASRGGLALSSANSGTLSLFTSLPTPVQVSGQVTVMETPKPSAATVTLVATKLDGVEPGVITSFVRTLQVKDDGAFQVDLLPGTYQVTAVPTGTPASGGLAAATAEWVVGATPSQQFGRVIELGNILAINGVAQDPSGAVAMAGAQVQATPSPSSIVIDLLKQALGEPTYVPRGNASATDTGGNFGVFVDSGTYDFSIRPLASSGYAWFVSPGMKVNASVGLNTLSLPLPVPYSGRIAIPGSDGASSVAVPGALIDAYIYTRNGAYTSDATQADSLLLIGEARTEQDGSFKLLIPAALNTQLSP